MPDLSHEAAHDGIVCGIDEAGRGPLAGPVIAAAVILPIGFDPVAAAKIDDSKRLPLATREFLYERIILGARWAVGEASVEEIDSVNILQATYLAMTRAVVALGAPGPIMALVDGNRLPPALPCPGRTIVKGDSISLSIAAASIIAKVTRDRLMNRLALAHPHYGWATNAGYGTAAHLRAIKQHGPTPHHRRSFAPLSEENAIKR